MTNKTQALWSAIVSGVSGYLAYFINLQPAMQTGILGELVEILPFEWRPAAAGITKTLSTVLGIYAGYTAAKSGPATPPKNPTNE